MRDWRMSCFSTFLDLSENVAVALSGVWGHTGMEGNEGPDRFADREVRHILHDE